MSSHKDYESLFVSYISLIRNMFLNSSIGISVIIFSNNFTKFNKHITLIGLTIIFFSIIYGIKSSYNFYKYINLMKLDENLSGINNLQIDHWFQWIYLHIIYITILILILLIVLYRKIL